MLQVGISAVGAGRSRRYPSVDFWVGIWLERGAELERQRVPLLLSVHLIACTVLAACRAMQWPYSGAFALERTSGRVAWQSTGGRFLCWALMLAAAAGIQLTGLP